MFLFQELLPLTLTFDIRPLPLDFVNAQIPLLQQTHNVNIGLKSNPDITSVNVRGCVHNTAGVKEAVAILINLIFPVSVHQLGGRNSNHFFQISP